ncbi:DUF6518 family protein [Streptomyces nigra]
MATLDAAVLTPKRAWGWSTVGSLFGGFAVGVLTNLAQGWLSSPWSQIPNSGAVWSVVAFAAGAMLVSRVSLVASGAAGLLAEWGLVAGYYGYAELGRDGMGDVYWPLVWMAMATVAGPLFGIAGRWWRRGQNVRRRIAGLAALAGVFGQEAIHYAWVLHYAAQAWTCLAVLVLVPLTMARTHRERALTLMTAAFFSFIAYAVVHVGLLDRALGSPFHLK